MDKKGKITISIMLISVAFIVMMGGAVIGGYGGEKISGVKMASLPCTKDCTRSCSLSDNVLKFKAAGLSASDCRSQCLQAKCNQNMLSGKCNAYTADSCCNLFAPKGQDPDCVPFSKAYLNALASKGIDVSNAQVITSPNGYEWVFVNSVSENDTRVRATCGEITRTAERAQYFEHWGIPPLPGVCREAGGFDQFRAYVSDTMGQGRSCVLTYSGMGLDNDGAADDGFQMASRCNPAGLGTEGFMLVQYQFI